MADVVVERLEVGVYDVPTEEPESDGTLEWEKTTVVTVEPVASDGTRAVGFTYGTGACARLVSDVLEEAVTGTDALDVDAAWRAMVRKIRNFGRPGIASMAISAVETALCDLKARLLGQPLHQLLGAVRDAAPVYGSGGFTSYSERQLVAQLSGWAEQGIPRVKMKIGRDPEADVRRVEAARRELGEEVELFVDANGAYDRKLALRQARRFEELGVTWFEEPVSSDDLEGLALLREQTNLEVTAGEYGYDLPYFERMLAAEAVDVLQLDVSRCAALAQARALPVSAHCAQSLHVALGCSVENCRHLEYFHDHARVDRLLFDGVLDPREGTLRPHGDRPGLGLELKRADAERFVA